MHISNRRGTWVLSYSNALRREVQYRPASKPSQSAFAGSPKHGWNFIVQSVGIFTERRFCLLRKRQLPWLSCRELLRIKGGNASLPWVCVGQTGNRVKRGDRKKSRAASPNSSPGCLRWPIRQTSGRHRSRLSLLAHY